MAKKRKPRTKRMYFTKVHENAIIEFNNPDTPLSKKSELYEKLIHPALDEMVDKIVYTYKFTSLPNISEEPAKYTLASGQQTRTASRTFKVPVVMVSEVKEG